MLIVVVIIIVIKVNDLHKRNNMRFTRQRRAILEEFGKVNTHLTADDIYEKVRRKMARVSLGTIYRNLEILADRGIIRKIELAGHQKVFDGNTGRHYHLRCLACDSLVDVAEEKVTIDYSTLANDGQFEVTGHRLELVGLCKGCKESAAKV